MIDVQNVRKEFAGFAALGGATLTVPNGAVYGRGGPNGAGKSTLIRHITGCLLYTSFCTAPLFTIGRRRSLRKIMCSCW